MHARQRRIIEAGIAETIDPLLRLQPAAERTNAERLGTQRAGEHGVIGIGVMRNSVDREARVELERRECGVDATAVVERRGRFAARIILGDRYSFVWDKRL